MKKSLFTLAAAAVVLASCTSDDLLVDEKVQETGTETAIGFGTLAQKATRAENSLETEELSLKAHHDAFAVWGFKDVDKENYVFGLSTTQGTTVSYVSGSDAVYYTQAECDAENATHLVNDAAGVAPGADGYVTTYAEGYTALTTASVKTAAVPYVWTYSPIRFWDKNSNRYDYYAAAPVTATATTGKPQWTLNGVVSSTDATKVAANPQAGYFTLTGVELANATLTSQTFSQSMKGQANTDYMVASEKHVLNAAYGTEVVAFDFNHILSRLNITVARGAKLNKLAETKAADAKLQIVKLEVRNILSKGDFDESTEPTAPATLAKGTTVRWSNTSAGITYEGVATDNVSDRIYLLQSLLIPQTVVSKTTNRDGSGDTSAAYLYVEYKIGTDNTTTGEKAETFKAYYNLASVFGVTSADATLAFNEGWQNTLNLTIDADAIEFTANTYKWDDDKNENLDIK